MEIIDISVSVEPGMARWPGHPEVTFDQYRDKSKGHSSNSTAISFSVHTGTHVDAPFHFLEKGKSVDQIPLGTFLGDAWVVEFPERDVISASDLEGADIPPHCQRILLKTRNSGFWEKGSTEFDPHYVALDSSAAHWLVERKIQLVGIDALSIQRFKRPEDQTHDILLAAGITIVEGLNLTKASEGKYELICLPLNLKGIDGAPARVVLIRR